jgi:glycosyltransferase involved in cell wall biosynthesis
MVCLEAMSFGKPVVCTSNIGLVEYLCPGVDAIVVPPDNQQELSGAVYELAKSTDYRKKIGEAARKTAGKMRWEVQAEKMINVIEGVV